MTIKVGPLEDRVLVQRYERDDRPEGALIEAPDSAKRVSQYARVLAVGPAANQVRVGDRVLIGRYAGTDIRVGRDNLVIAREGELLAVVEEG